MRMCLQLFQIAGRTLSRPPALSSASAGQPFASGTQAPVAVDPEAALESALGSATLTVESEPLQSAP